MPQWNFGKVYERPGVAFCVLSSGGDMLDLDRLCRSDLEALALFKLWQEMRIAARECREAVRHADIEWLLLFLKHSGQHIAMAPLDGILLSQARSHARA